MPQIDELRDFMSHLGLLNGRSPAESNAVVVSAFASADNDKDNALNLQEFTTYYHRATAPRLGDLLKSDYPEDMIALRQAFINWASFGSGNNNNNSGGSGNGHSAPSGVSRVQLGSAHWLKLCRDTGLVGRGALTSTDADLIFAKVKPRGLQKINFSHFVDALGAVATRLNNDLILVVRQVTTSDGPIVNGTTVHVSHYNHTIDSTRAAPAGLSLHQRQHQQRRKSAPDVVPAAHQPHSTSSSSFLNQPTSRPTSAKERFLLDSNNNDGNNNDTATPTTNSDGFKIPAHRSDTSSQARSSPHHTVHDNNADDNNDIKSENGRRLSSNIEQVLVVFGEFAGFGTGNSTIRNSGTFGGTSTMTGRLSTGNMTPTNMTGSSTVACEKPSPIKMEMDSKQFLKLCKDSGLVTTPATSVAADLCFTKAKARGARRLAFADFLVALALLAQEKKCAEADILAQVAACTGPRRNSTTTAEFSRLHDDKDTYTGVYARGGPKTVDSSVPDLAKLLSRE